LIDQELDEDFAFGRTGFAVSQNGVLVFQSVSDSASELVWFSRDGVEQGRIPDPGAGAPTISPDGNFLAVASDELRNGKRFVRVHDLQRGVATRLTEGGVEEFPTWAPDGSKLAYTLMSLPDRVYEIRVDRSGDPAVLLAGPAMTANDYSPDGRYLIYMTFERGAPEMAVYDGTTGKSELVGRGGEAQFSPDGKWIAHSAPGQVIVRPFPVTGARIQISSHGGAQPRWSRNGKRLYFTAPDRKLMVADIEVSGGSLTAGAPRPLFQTRITAPRFAVFQYDIVPDESRFLINSLKPEAPLTLLNNWPAAL
jgi:Tol biopolymer transport system component